MAKQDERVQMFINLLRKRGVQLQSKANDEKICQQFRDKYAVMILDSSGFTRLTRDFGIIHFMSLVVDMRDRTIPILKKHHALDCWYEADNLYGIFYSAKDAVNAAIQTQLTVMKQNVQRQESEGLDVCIGIGFGYMLYVASNHIFGQEMNFASKLGEDIAQPGEILLTESAYKAIADQVTGLQADPRTTIVSDVTISYYCIKASRSVSWKT